MNGMPTAAAAGKIDVGGDLTVNRLGFGAMRITGPGIWGDPPDRDRAIQALRRAVALDVTFIDTADSCGPRSASDWSPRPFIPIRRIWSSRPRAGWRGRAQGSGYLMAARSTCARRARAAWPGCDWTGSTCTSSTGLTPRYRSPSQSARWPS